MNPIDPELKKLYPEQFEDPNPPQAKIIDKPQLPPEMVSTIEKFVSNPLFSIAAKSHVPEIQKYISDNAGEYEEVVYEYLRGKYPSIYNLLRPAEINAGLTNEGTFQTDTRTNQENESYAEFEDSNTISKEVWEEVLSEMVRLSDEGNSPGKIREFIFEDYGIELTHQQIMKDVQRFKQSEKAQRIAEEEEEARLREEEAELDKARQNASKRILDLIAENKKLTERIHELEKTLAVKEAVESAKNPKPQTETKEQVGLIRAAWKKLY